MLNTLPGSNADVLIVDWLQLVIGAMAGVLRLYPEKPAGRPPA